MEDPVTTETTSGNQGLVWKAHEFGLDNGLDGHVQVRCPKPNQDRLSDPLVPSVCEFPIPMYRLSQWWTEAVQKVHDQEILF